jgi:mannose/cellobiose epimerase-like protein (N-acyl-D-glucosamine 2-epimerase family)
LTAAAQPAAREFVPRLERNLRKNIIPFWYPSTLDKANGGYIINHDAQGKLNPAGSKGIVTQARQLWLFSRLARGGYDSKEMRGAADHGFAFLRDKMWDRKNGGFYWEVDASGAKVIRPGKNMYGESFALYGLSEYARASKSKAAVDLANELFTLFEKHAYDPQFGGYRESFNADWTAVPANDTGYMQVPPAMKLMNTHLHLLESVTAYCRATESRVARERLGELIDIESNSVVRKHLTACTDKYDRNWTPRLDAAKHWNRVSYGHDLENVWLLADACKALDNSPYPLVDLFRDLWAYSEKYGYDSERGGFWNSGPFDAPADDRIKVWWVQAEAIVSALHMYRLTQEEKYWDTFAKTYDFIDKYQTDWKVGEWHETITADLQPKGAKAHIWKAGYHNGRAMIECLDVLRGM